MDNNKGYNITKLDFLPSEFYYYDFKKIRVRDLSISQVTNLSILNGMQDLSKIIEIYAPSFIDLTVEQVENLLYIDFITCVHFINHLTFGVYNNSFTHTCKECSEKSKVDFNLYSLDFKANKVKSNEVKYNDYVIKLKNFTVGSMAKIVSEGLENDKNAFLVSCIDSVSLNGIVDGSFDDFAKGIESLKQFPYRFMETVNKAIKDRYPVILPLTTFLSCGHKLVFKPDLTLKGLPKITSI